MSHGRLGQQLAHAPGPDGREDLVGAERCVGGKGHLANHRHFFRALRSMGPNTSRRITTMTSISPMIYGTGTRSFSSSNQSWTRTM